MATPSFYEALAEIPVYTGAQFTEAADTSEQLAVRVTTSVVDHNRLIKRNLVKYVQVIPTEKKAFATPSQDLSDAVLTCISPSGKLIAVLREATGDKGDKKRFVEIWEHERLVVNVEVTKEHGAFYADEIFASSSFSPSENDFLYTAEYSEEFSSNNESSEDKRFYDKYRFVPPLGERYVGKKHPTTFIVRWDHPDSSNLSDAKGRPFVQRVHFLGTERVLFGQAAFGPSGSIFVTGYSQTTEGRVLGLVGCYNRPAAIYISKPKDVNDERDAPDHEPSRVVEFNITKVDIPGRSSRSVRLFWKGNEPVVVWLSNELGGPHQSCSKLHKLVSYPGAEQSIVVDSVWDPLPSDVFLGLYLDQLPKNPFLQLLGELFILTHSARTHYSALYLISLSTGRIREIGAGPSTGSRNWTVLGTDGENHAICATSSLASPHELYLLTFRTSGDYDELRIDQPTLSRSTSVALSELHFFVHIRSQKVEGHVETIILQKTPSTSLTTSASADKLPPCILMPHGGPHGSTSTAFNALTVALALEGYTIAQPNYTGSLGYGEKYVKDLIGKCGKLDVNECMNVLKDLVEKGFATEGPGKQFIYGGSHGGFITGHLIGQFPGFFSAAIMRNPVTNAAEMLSTTDIPDWCFAEFGITYTIPTTSADPPANLSVEDLSFLQQSSPIHYIDAVETPVFVLIGEQDQRVPPSQGRNYFFALKSRRKDADMLIFPGRGHPLVEPDCAKASFEAARAFFGKYRK